MELGHLQASRPSWVDRNPSNQSQRYNTGAIAPHAVTQRWTHTVATGKKERVQHTYMGWRRVTAAAPVGIVTLDVQYTPNGGTVIHLQERRTLLNAVNDLFDESYNAQLDMFAGDLLEAYTTDLSTGGTTEYNIAAVIVAYDA